MFMAKKKLEVSLSPIAAQIDKATKTIKALKRGAPKADQQSINSALNDLLEIRALVVKACGGRMTRVFLPVQEEE
jgi:hypothetical protein